MHIVSFQNNSVFFNSYFKCVEQEFFRIELAIFRRYYVVKLEKCEIVFKRLANNCVSLDFLDETCVNLGNQIVVKTIVSLPEIGEQIKLYF